jgi:hypothetical protein
MVFFESIEDGRYLRTLITSMAVRKNLSIGSSRCRVFTQPRPTPDIEATVEGTFGVARSPDRALTNYLVRAVEQRGRKRNA